MLATTGQIGKVVVLEASNRLCFVAVFRMYPQGDMREALEFICVRQVDRRVALTICIIRQHQWLARRMLRLGTILAYRRDYYCCIGVNVLARTADVLWGLDNIGDYDEHIVPLFFCVVDLCVLSTIYILQVVAFLHRPRSVDVSTLIQVRANAALSPINSILIWHIEYT